MRYLAQNTDNLLVPFPIVLPANLSADLSGETGTNREQALPCEIRAKNDHEAVLCWLDEYKHSIATYKSYQKEAERLLLWCVLQHKKPLSSLDRADIAGLRVAQKDKISLEIMNMTYEEERAYLDKLIAEGQAKN